MIDLLFLSNGYGEDAIAAKIAEFLRGQCNVGAVPLVGKGQAYGARQVEVLMQFPLLPSGGLSVRKDLKKGLHAVVKMQWDELKRLGKDVRYVVAVGDLFPCTLARFALKKPFVFVGTARSNHVQAYNFFERWGLRKALHVFVRDQETAVTLEKRKVKAQYVGNPMMDETEEHKLNFHPFAGRTIALFPGSREDSMQNFAIQIEALHAIARMFDSPVRGILLLPPTFTLQSYLPLLIGWDRAIASSSHSSIEGEFALGNVSLLFVRDCLGDVLRASSLVLGQAGTANEQAAGAGRPVVAFDFEYYRNGKPSWYRWRQKKLLGKALEVVKPNGESVARTAVQILKSRSLYEAMAAFGRERMGVPGACSKIAEWLLGMLEAVS